MNNNNTWQKPKQKKLYSGEMQESWEIFLTAIQDNKVREGTTKVIPVRTSFVDMLDYNYPAAVLLTQIVYWHLPQEKDGKIVNATKLGVFKYGHYWLAKSRDKWFKEGVRLTPRQIDGALEKLEAKGYIKVILKKFNNTPTHHIRLTEKFFNDFFAKELQAIKVSDEKVEQKKTLSHLEDYETVKSDLTKLVKSYNIDNRTKITDNIVTYSASTESVSTSNVVTNTSLPSVNQEEAKPAETFVPVGEISGGDSRNASVEEGPQVSDYSKYTEYAEQGWQLVDQVKNPQPRPLTDKDPYFFHAWVANKEQEYPWPQDMQNQWVLDQLKMVEDEWVDEFFDQPFKKKMNHRVHIFLEPGILDKLRAKSM